MAKLFPNNWLLFFRNGSSVFLGLIFFSSGMAKVYAENAFPGLIGPVWLEEKLTEFDLGMYARFIGYAQVGIGFLLLTLRFSTLGAVMLVPLVANIFMVTVSMNWTGTPYVLGFFIVVNAFVLWVDRKRLYPLIHLPMDLSPSHPPKSGKGHLCWILGAIAVWGSIQLSYWNFPLAYATILLGLLLGFLSKIIDVNQLKNN